MPKFRKKPIEIEARQFTVDSKEQVLDWITCLATADVVNGKPIIRIDTLEGQMIAREGDWVIRGVKGEFYPCKPEIFDASYDPVEE